MASRFQPFAPISGGFSHHAAGISRKLTRATDRVLIFSAGYLLAADALAGVYRYVLVAAHLTAIIYFPLMVITAGIVISIIVHLRSEAPALGLVTALIGLVFSILLSMLVGRSMPEVFFALYTFLPLFLGLMIGQRGLYSYVFKQLAVLFFITAVGVMINKAFNFPWAGATYEIGGAKLGMARQWNTGSTARLAGFSRASFASASYLLLGYVAYLRYDRSLLRILVCLLIATITINLTTSKTQLTLIVLMPLLMLITRHGMSRLKGARYAVSAIAALLMVGMPITSYILDYNGSLDPARGRIVDSSFIDRIVNTWPYAINLIRHDNSTVEWLIGRGIGGIGASQQLFDPYNYDPADSFPIFIFVTWGFSSILLLLVLFRKTLSFARIQTPNGATLWLFALSLLGCGTTTSVVESPSLALLLGLVCSTTLPGQRQSHRAVATVPPNRLKDQFN